MTRFDSYESMAFSRIVEITVNTLEYSVANCTPNIPWSGELALSLLSPFLLPIFVGASIHMI